MDDDRDDMRDGGSEAGSGIKWFILGAALGAGLGILFAPQAGERTRRSIARGARKLQTRAREELDDLAAELELRGEQIKDRVSEFADDFTDEVHDGRRHIERATLGAREELEQKLAERRSLRRAAATADGAAEDDESDD